MELNPKAIAFAENFVLTGDVLMSAKNVGENFAYGNAQMQDPQVSMYIKELMFQQTEYNVAQAGEVLQVLTHELREGFGNNRMRAAELLGRRYKLFEPEAPDQNASGSSVQGVLDNVPTDKRADVLDAILDVIERIAQGDLQGEV